MSERTAVVVAVAILVCSISGCSSERPPGHPGQGMLPAGTARVVINDGLAGGTNAVRCNTTGDLTTIITGDDASGMTALITNTQGLAAATVSINHLGGFTGSYDDGLTAQPAQVSMTGRTYDITGTADGFNTHSPSVRTTGDFAIKVAC